MLLLEETLADPGGRFFEEMSTINAKRRSLKSPNQSSATGWGRGRPIIFKLNSFYASQIDADHNLS